MNDIVNNLHFLKEIHASNNLHGKIQRMTGSLPAAEVLPAFPWFYAARIALAVLLLFVFLGSGVVLAAYHSNPGSPLFPVKKAIVQTQLQFVRNPVAREKLQQEIATPTPTPVLPTPTDEPTPTKEEENKPSIQVTWEEKKNESLHPTTVNSDNGEKNTIENKVLGAQTKRDRNEHTKIISSLTPSPTVSLKHEKED